MSKVSITRSLLDDLATSISAKSGASLPLTLDEMKDAVDGMQPGGTLVTKNITSNGTYDAEDDNADGYSSVTVNVPTPTPTLQTKTKTYTPTESAQTESVSADAGYDAIDTVNVTVNAISSTYVGSQVARNDSSDLTVSGSTVTAPAGYYASSASKTVASPVKTKTGTFTGNGTRTIDVACDFEPDLVYVSSDPGTTASSGTVAFIIARDMMAASRYRNNSTTNSHYAVTPCVNLNTSGSSYSWRATYANSKVTLYSYSNNTRALLTNGRTYTYKFVKWTT